MNFNHNKQERIWKLLDDLKLYGEERAKAEPLIRAFQLEIEKKEEMRVRKLTEEVWKK